MKKVLTSLVALTGGLMLSSLHAQDIEKEFENFIKEQNTAFEQFKNKADADFENYLRQAWEEFEAFKPLETPVRPEPPQPVVFNPESPSSEPVSVPVGEEVVPEQYKPIEVDIPKVSPIQQLRRTPIVFYGSTFEIATESASELPWKGTAESDVADAWKYLCQNGYEALLSDCLSAKKRFHLNDWAYLLFAKAVGVQLYGADKTDQITFLQMFLLSKSGYKVRLAKIDDQLRLLVLQ